MTREVSKSRAISTSTFTDHQGLYSFDMQVVKEIPTERVVIREVPVYVDKVRDPLQVDFETIVDDIFFSDCDDLNFQVVERPIIKEVWTPVFLESLVECTLLLEIINPRDVHAHVCFCPQVPIERIVEKLVEVPVDRIVEVVSSAHFCAT